MSGSKFDDAAFSELFDRLNKPYITGLTISGGEPLDLQDLEKLAFVYDLVKKFRDRFNNTKDIWIFTGNLLEDLEVNSITRDILKEVDYLVDGRYIQELRDISLPFRGSKNQVIYKKNEFGLFEPDEELN